MIESSRPDDRARSMATSAAVVALAAALTSLVLIAKAHHDGDGRPLVYSLIFTFVTMPPALIWLASTLLPRHTTLRGAIGGLWLLYGLLMILVAWFSFLGFWLIPNSLPHDTD
jgi:hypothetical protein